MMETVEQENVDDVLKEVDEAIVNEALPAPPAQPVAEEPACAYEGLLTNTTPRLRLPSLHHANHLVDRRAAALIVPALQNQLLHFYTSFPLLNTTIGNRLPNHRLLSSFHSLNQLRVRTPLQTHVAHVRNARSVPARPLAHHLVDDAPERVHVHLRRARLVAQQLWAPCYSSRAPSARTCTESPRRWLRWRDTSSALATGRNQTARGVH